MTRTPTALACKPTPEVHAVKYDGIKALTVAQIAAIRDALGMTLKHADLKHLSQDISSQIGMALEETIESGQIEQAVETHQAALAKAFGLNDPAASTAAALTHVAKLQQQTTLVSRLTELLR